MDKYIIEGGFDFYEELYKSLDIEEINEKTEADNNLCLITNQLLTDNFVKLNCGHKFNYSPLFLDLKNHKQKFNGLEGTSSKLSTDEIRCPYCRTKQKGVLQYYEELGLEKINGVNDINPFAKQNNHSYHYKNCTFKTPNPSYDPSGNNPVETSINNTGNCQFHCCFSYGSYKYTQLGEDNIYCYQHKKIIQKKIQDDAKQKLKETKQKLKEEKQKAKEEAKMKEKEEKQKAKEEAKLKEKKEKQKKPKAMAENVVLGQIDLSGNTLITGCVEILKSGQNKGNPCGCKKFLDDLCNRHFKIKNGIVINNI
jgi:hypothetical protein